MAQSPTQPFSRLMTAECTCRGEFAQAVTDHVFGNIDRHMAASVVDRDRVSHHLGEDHRGAAPGADHFLLFFLVHGLDTLEQFRLNVRDPFSMIVTYLLTSSNSSGSSCCDGAQCTDPSSCCGGSSYPGWAYPTETSDRADQLAGGLHHRRVDGRAGLIAVPRTVGRMPRWRLRPALPSLMLPWSRFPT
jgi:hypothetical protein